MEIRQLKAFIAIADAHTFTAAAQRIHYTQAALSMQIKQLEKEVGVPLFTRMPRRVVLTEAGEKLLERAHLILREHDAALSELAELAGAKHGRLRVGSASGMVSADALPSILKRLRKAHPHADVSVSSGTSEGLVKKILAGEIDTAFVSLPVQARNIETEMLSQDQLVAIASPRHPLAKQRVVSAFALAGEKLILGERGGNTRRLIDEFFAEAGLKPSVAMELSRQAAIKNMVAADMGIGIVPLSLVREEVERGRLVRWWIEGARINWEMGVARLSGGYLSPVCQTFLTLCREHFAAESDAADKRRARATKPTRGAKKRGSKTATKRPGKSKR
ncbi:MAG: LysR family transcriptional regulator, low CO2-responsive transcriptional regulator [Acidobacteriota bacterium]|jgi:DNA-binding transcriptional LysR family regulator|nr:LysR family transcriptional regulator, low CO2-responsive transcriptional regulator [Acidobacteriota bacterium]